MPSITCPIVGAHFRPPAKSILQALPGGHTLFARREPDNAYDANAIKVLVASASFDPEGDEAPDNASLIADDLDTLCAGQGFRFDDLLAEPEWHLGYIPKEIAAELAPKFDSTEGPDGMPFEPIGTLGFDAKGKPTFTFTLEE